jgi:[ribosomal protein S5]-alanine N-acetyltransferase
VVPLLTERLVLRPHEESDVEFMVVLNADPEVNRFTPDGPLEVEAAMKIVLSLQRQFRERRMGRFVVLLKESGEPLGWCGLKPTAVEQRADLGYRFAQRWWGQGFATEAARACVRYGFDELSLERLTAEADVGNVRSVRVLEKLGFRLRGREGDTATWELRRHST